MQVDGTIRRASSTCSSGDVSNSSGTVSTHGSPHSSTTCNDALCASSSPSSPQPRRTANSSSSARSGAMLSIGSSSAMSGTATFRAPVDPSPTARVRRGLGSSGAIWRRRGRQQATVDPHTHRSGATGRSRSPAPPGSSGPTSSRQLVEVGAHVAVLVRDDVRALADLRSAGPVRSPSSAARSRTRPSWSGCSATTRSARCCTSPPRARWAWPTATPWPPTRPTWPARGPLLEAVRRSPRVEQVVTASSDKAYGAQPALPYDEDMPLLAVNPYDVSKACADLISTSYHRTFGVPVCVTRCGNFFGPGDRNWERLVPGTIRSLLRGERPVIRSDGTMVRDYLYVVDGALAYLRLVEAMARRPRRHRRGVQLLHRDAAHRPRAGRRAPGRRRHRRSSPTSGPRPPTRSTASSSPPPRPGRCSGWAPTLLGRGRPSCETVALVPRRTSQRRPRDRTGAGRSRSPARAATSGSRLVADLAGGPRADPRPSSAPPCRGWPPRTSTPSTCSNPSSVVAERARGRATPSSTWPGTTRSSPPTTRTGRWPRRSLAGRHIAEAAQRRRRRARRLRVDHPRLRRRAWRPGATRRRGRRARAPRRLRDRPPRRRAPRGQRPGRRRPPPDATPSAPPPTSTSTAGRSWPPTSAARAVEHRRARAALDGPAVARLHRPGRRGAGHRQPPPIPDAVPAGTYNLGVGPRRPPCAPWPSWSRTASKPAPVAGRRCRPRRRPGPIPSAYRVDPDPPGRPRVPRRAAARRRRR